MIPREALENQIEALRYLLGEEGQVVDFREPSLLKDVSTITTYNTKVKLIGASNAELGSGFS